jgi:hypothetical protein
MIEEELNISRETLILTKFGNERSFCKIGAQEPPQRPPAVQEFLAKRKVNHGLRTPHLFTRCHSLQLLPSHFETLEEIRKVTMAALNNYFITWNQGWVSRIAAGRKYFEGDHCSLG